MVTILFSKSNRRVIKTDKKNVDLKTNTITNKKNIFPLKNLHFYGEIKTKPQNLYQNISNENKYSDWNKEILQFKSVALVTRDTVILWSCSSRSPPWVSLPARPALLQLGLLLGAVFPFPKGWIVKYHSTYSPKRMHSWKWTGSRGTHSIISMMHEAKYIDRNNFYTK